MPKTKTESDSLTFHPACLAFPELPDDELQALAADIKKHGLLNDITLLDKQILEGRSRYKACKRAGVKPRFTPLRHRTCFASGSASTYCPNRVNFLTRSAALARVWFRG